MSKLVTKVLATSAAVSLLTLPGLAPVDAASLSTGSAPESSTEESASPHAPAGQSPSGPAAGQSPSGPAAGSTSAADSTAESPASADAQDAPAGTRVQLLNITDFHGRIVEAGSQVASVVEEERATFTGDDAAGTAFLSAGDNIGASTYVSSSQQDTPTLDVLNAIGLKASAVGNHEFDKGVDDLTGRVSSEADFPYLAANVYEQGTTTVVDGLDAYTMIDVGGVSIAVIGVVTKDTASLVSPSGIEGLDFGDPTDAVNRVAGELEALPADEKPDMTVVEAHLGAATGESLEAAEESNAEFKKLVTETDASVDALFTGHTHLPYAFDAPVPGDPDRTRPVLEAGNYGSHVGQLELTSEGDGNWSTASSELIPTKDKDYASPVVDEVKRIIAEADEKAKGPGSKVKGTITEDITRAFTDGKENRGAESTLGNLVADALKDGVEDSQLAPADFGITNPGGLRADLRCDDIYNNEEPCQVTAAELNAVLPFANDHGVVTMKGADVIGLFEEQWQPEGASRPFLHLGISDELDVVYDSTAEAGQRVKSVLVNGKPIDPNKDYRVATLSFLASGGDNFTSFKKGSFELSGLTDFETWEAYFAKHTPVSPDKTERQADAALDVIGNGQLGVEFTAPSQGIAPGESGDFLLSTDAEEAVPGPIELTVDVPEGYTVEAAKAQSGKRAGGGAAGGGAAAGTARPGEAGQVKDPNIPVVDAHVAGQKTIMLDSIPAGESTLPITVKAPEDAKDDVTVTVTLQAGVAEWWDDNPMPLAHAYDATAQITEDAAAEADAGGAEADAGGDTSGGSDSSAAGNDDGSSDAGSGGSSDADAGGADSGADSGASTSSSNGSSSASGGSDSGSGGSGSGGSGANASGSKDGGDLPRTGFEAMNLVAAALALIVAGGAAVSAMRRRRAEIDI